MLNRNYDEDLQRLRVLKFNRDDYRFVCEFYCTNLSKANKVACFWWFIFIDQESIVWLSGLLVVTHAFLFINTYVRIHVHMWLSCFILCVQMYIHRSRQDYVYNKDDLDRLEKIPREQITLERYG